MSGYYFLSGLILGIVLAFTITYYILTVDLPLLSNLCAEKFNYNTTDIQTYKDCMSNPDFYGIDRRSHK
jgi:hypothetical protein